MERAEIVDVSDEKIEVRADCLGNDIFLEAKDSWTMW